MARWLFISLSVELIFIEGGMRYLPGQRIGLFGKEI
jgi:hypothetical protein